VSERSSSIVLIGNPNTGKTTLFNQLTGLSLRTGNYPGVTVEKKTGTLKGSEGVELLDLPGTYSLAARSPDEMVAVDVLLGRQEGTEPPDAVVVVADASNIERNLYLATQVFETGLPVIVALNMSDAARARGIEVDHAQLAKQLGVEVVPTVARSGEGLEDLRAAILRVAGSEPAKPGFDWPAEYLAAEESFAGELDAAGVTGHPALERRRAILDQGGEAERRLVALGGEAVERALERARAAASQGDLPVQALEATLRYRWIGEVVGASVTRPAERPITASDRADRVLTHGIWGTLTFVGVSYLVFASIFSWAGPMMDLVDGIFGAIGDQVSSWAFLGDGAVKSLAVDGVVAGVGGVLIFLPQVMLLFGFIAILEDCGYMARAAFLMDRLFRWCGLSGRSFIPMLSSFACAVPGIMASRTVEDRQDRIATILVSPLMSCSARIPVYVILIAAFIPARKLAGVFELQAVVFGSMYLLGILIAIPVAWLLKKTLLKGQGGSFLMELPPYKWPRTGTVLRRMGAAGRNFVTRAGTLILAASLVIWALSYWPRDPQATEGHQAQLAASQVAVDSAPATAHETALAAHEELEARLAAEAGAAHLRYSLMGRMGRLVEPVFAPIGWDWKVSVAVLSSFPAREVVVASLGVIYGLGEVDEESTALQERIRTATWDHGPKQGQRVMDLGGALALMVFFALCAQCAATLVTIKKESGSWGWAALSFVYMTSLAYVGALITAVTVRAIFGG
jgi:ferrous iron transport protein B